MYVQRVMRPEACDFRFGNPQEMPLPAIQQAPVLMQYAMEDLEKAIIDVPAMQRRRDIVVNALTEMGYEAVNPEGTFYVMVRSPIADDLEFTRRLANEDVFVLPGRMFELPGWFRISLTGSDAMVERALPGFEKAIEKEHVAT